MELSVRSCWLGGVWPIQVRATGPVCSSWQLSAVKQVTHGAGLRSAQPWRLVIAACRLPILMRRDRSQRRFTHCREVSCRRRVPCELAGRYLPKDIVMVTPTFVDEGPLMSLAIRFAWGSGFRAELLRGRRRLAVELACRGPNDVLVWPTIVDSSPRDHAGASSASTPADDHAFKISSDEPTNTHRVGISR